MTRGGSPQTVSGRAPPPAWKRLRTDHMSGEESPTADPDSRGEGDEEETGRGEERWGRRPAAGETSPGLVGLGTKCPQHVDQYAAEA
eukprot:761405-Hanusia_phi.AAC.8